MEHALQQYQWLVSLPSLMIISLIGMITHFFKKNITGETTTEIKNYFMDHFKSTVVAFTVTVIATLSTYLTLASGQAIDLLAFYGIGYTFDSIFNKWDKV